MIYITYKVNNLDNSKLISGVFARTKRSTIGDKIVETLFSNGVNNSRSSTFSFIQSWGVLISSLPNNSHRTLFHRVLAL